MRNPLILAVGLAMIAGAAMAHDPSGRPEAGAFVPHVVGANGDGTPEIHRPAGSTHDAASNGVARLTGGADDNSITYTGPQRGSFGFPTAARVVDNVDGQPVVEHGHRPAGSR